MELNYTQDKYFQYYIDFLTNKSTNSYKSTRSPHVIHYTTRTTRSKFQHLFIVNDSKTLNTNHEMSKLIRLACFVTFFIVSVLFIFLLSKLYACLRGMNKRKKRYGYYVNHKLERVLADFRNKLKYEKLKYEVKSTNNNNNNSNNTNKVTTLYDHDMGHVNESFDPHNELVMIDEHPVKNAVPSERKQEKNRLANFIANYFETKRINSFGYGEFSNENDSLNEFSTVHSIKHTKLDMIKKIFNKSKLKSETSSSSIPLFTISDGNSSRSSSQRSNNTVTSFIDLKNSKSSLSSSGFNSFSSQSVSSVAFELPVILITDTSEMSTSIIDLDTFEPENCQKNSKDFLYKYSANEKRPSLFY